MSTHTSLKGAVALVTGANRGIGTAFVSGLLEAGAGRVYAAARDPQTLASLAQSDARVVPITLDITEDTSVQAAAARLIDVDLAGGDGGEAGVEGRVVDVIQNAPDLIDAEDDQKGLNRTRTKQVEARPGALEGDLEKELERRDGVRES